MRTEWHGFRIAFCMMKTNPTTMKPAELRPEPVGDPADLAAAANDATPSTPIPPAGNWVLTFIRGQAARWLGVLAITELALLAASLWAAMHLRFWGDAAALAEFSERLGLKLALFAGVIVIAMAALGMYQPRMREGWFGMFARQAVGFALGGVGLVIAFYAIPGFYVGRGVMATALMIGFISVSAFRSIFMRVVDTEMLKRRVLVLGAGRRAALIGQRMRRRVDRRGFHLVGFRPLANEHHVVPAESIVSPKESLVSHVQRLHIAEIVVGPDDRRGQLPMEELLECKQRGVLVTDLATFFERELGSINLSLADPSWLVFSKGFDASQLRWLSKRFFDLVVAALVLLLAWPFMLMTALAIRIESGLRAPVLYRQERVGLNGRTFLLNKFRSMGIDAEKDGVARWATKDDDRVTRVGRFIRKVRLDELPQLWNVLVGDMSFVGPRPERPTFVDQLTQKIRYYPLRHCVKPGLAGWAQLNYAYGASEDDAAEKLTYDLFYVKNHDFFLDLLILVQTVEIVLFGRGAR